VPVAPTLAFQALKAVAERSYDLKTADDFSLSVTFSALMSGFTFGEKLSGQVIPSGEAATIRLSVAGNISTSVFQASKNQKQIDKVFHEVTELLKEAVANGGNIPAF